MCRIVTGDQIKEKRDLQQLITGSIFRAKAPFSATALYREVEQKSRGNQAGIGNEEISEMVDNTLISLLRADLLTISHGIYSVVMPEEFIPLLREIS